MSLLCPHTSCVLITGHNTHIYTHSPSPIYTHHYVYVGEGLLYVPPSCSTPSLYKEIRIMNKNIIKMIVCALMGALTMTMVVRTTSSTPTHSMVSTMDTPSGDPIPTIPTTDDPTTSSTMEEGTDTTTTTPLPMEESTTSTSAPHHTTPTTPPSTTPPTTSTTMVSTPNSSTTPPTHPDPTMVSTPSVDEAPTTTSTTRPLPTTTTTTEPPYCMTEEEGKAYYQQWIDHDKGQQGTTPTTTTRDCPHGRRPSDPDHPFDN